MWRLSLPLLLLVIASCPSTPAALGCADDDDCPAGSSCSAGVCLDGGGGKGEGEGEEGEGEGDAGEGEGDGGEGEGDGGEGEGEGEGDAGEGEGEGEGDAGEGEGEGEGEGDPPPTPDLRLIGLWRPERNDERENMVVDRSGLVPGLTLHRRGSADDPADNSFVIAGDRLLRSDVVSDRLGDALAARALTLLLDLTPLSNTDTQAVFLSVGSTASDASDDDDIDGDSALWIGAVADDLVVRVPIEDGTTIEAVIGGVVAIGQRLVIVVRVDVDGGQTRLRVRRLTGNDVVALSSEVPRGNGERLQIGAGGPFAADARVHNVAAFGVALNSAAIDALPARFEPIADRDGDLLADDEDPCPDVADSGAPGTGCARDGTHLQALWTFRSEVGGDVVDRSGNGPLPLAISGDARISDGSLEVNRSARDGRAESNTADSDRIVDAVIDSDEVSVEGWFETGGPAQGPASLVSFAKDGNERDVMLGLGRTGTTTTDLQVRLQIDEDETGTRGTGEGALAPLALPAGLHHVVLTWRADVIRAYVDGKQHSLQDPDTTFLTDAFDSDGSLDAWDLDGAVSVGNERNTATGFSGRVHLVAFYDRALDAAEALRHFTLGADGLAGVDGGGGGDGDDVDVDEDAVPAGVDCDDAVPNANQGTCP